MYDFMLDDTADRGARRDAPGGPGRGRPRLHAADGPRRDHLPARALRDLRTPQPARSAFSGRVRREGSVVGGGVRRHGGGGAARHRRRLLLRDAVDRRRGHQHLRHRGAEENLPRAHVGRGEGRRRGPHRAARRLGLLRRHQPRRGPRRPLRGARRQALHRRRRRGRFLPRLRAHQPRREALRPTGGSAPCSSTAVPGSR